jgi:DNA-binding NarL/FixJ family response regulator
MAAGKSNAAIGETLFLAERSVEKVIHSIFLKLGSRGRRRSTSASRP